MLFDVKPILHTPGKQLDFQFALDLSDLEFGGHDISTNSASGNVS